MVASTGGTPDSRFEIIVGGLRTVFSKVFRDYLHYTLIVVGIGALALVIGGYPDAATHARWHEFLKALSNTILLAGVVTTFMRFFASFDLIGRRIQEWLTHEEFLRRLDTRLADKIHNDPRMDQLIARLADAVYQPERINDLGALENIWSKLTLSVTRGAFPEIAQDAYTHTLKGLKAASESYYLESLTRDAIIKSVDESTGIVVIEYTYNALVVPRRGADDVKFESKIEVLEVPESPAALKYFEVNGKRQEVVPTTSSVRPNKILYRLSAPLQGSKTRIGYRISLTQNLREDPFLQWAATRYVKSMTQTVTYPKDKLEVSYRDVTMSELLKPSAADEDGYRCYTLEHGRLLFPGNAFMFVTRFI